MMFFTPILLNSKVAVPTKLLAFALSVIVHDTDSVRILVEAQGYAPYEERLVGVDLLGGKRFDIGLTPLQSATVNPPLPTSSKR